MIYDQKDPQFQDLNFGGIGSPAEFGCYLFNYINAMQLAGYNNCNPRSVINEMNEAGGFKNAYTQWAPLTRILPMLSIGKDNGGVHFENVCGTMPYKDGSRGTHWVLRDDKGVIYNPWGGDNELHGFVEKYHQDFYIIPAPTPTPVEEVQEQPAPVVPAPVQPAPVAPAVVNYEIKKDENLTIICADHYGLNIKNGDAYRKALEVAKFNKIENPDLIFPGQKITLP